MSILFKTLFVTLILCVTTSLKAQENTASIILGAAATQVHGDGIGGYNKLGLTFGIAVERSLNDKFSFQPEIIYCQKGSSAGANSGYNYKMKFNYLEIPVLFGLKLNDLFTLQGGPAVGYLLAANTSSGGGNEPFENINKTEVSTMFGVEYRALDSVSIKMRYGISAYSIAKAGNLHNDTVNFLLIFYLN